mmetsp:Transcript_39556/g.86178  ORF Transcript_39556/g.86178 Transcript_39556/m.86178 type:complete len:203 (+) Transcript_39556:381-989(+)
MESQVGSSTEAARRPTLPLLSSVRPRRDSEAVGLGSRRGLVGVSTLSTGSRLSDLGFGSGRSGLTWQSTGCLVAHAANNWWLPGSAVFSGGDPEAACSTGSAACEKAVATIVAGLQSVLPNRSKFCSCPSEDTDLPSGRIMTAGSVTTSIVAVLASAVSVSSATALPCSEGWAEASGVEAASASALSPEAFLAVSSRPASMR